jgi:hypothetical protein
VAGKINLREFGGLIAILGAIKPGNGRVGDNTSESGNRIRGSRVYSDSEQRSARGMA